MELFQWFLMALSVRPGNNFAISAHRLPNRSWASMMMRSSPGVPVGAQGVNGGAGKKTCQKKNGGKEDTNKKNNTNNKKKNKTTMQKDQQKNRHEQRTTQEGRGPERYMSVPVPYCACPPLPPPPPPPQLSSYKRLF